MTEKYQMCLSCGKRKAIKVEPFGYIYCKQCRERQAKLIKPKQTVEITTNEIRDSRKQFAEDIVQPFRDGALSKEYVQAYPETVKNMLKEGHITKDEVKHAKNQWDDINFYKRE